MCCAHYSLCAHSVSDTNIVAESLSGHLGFQYGDKGEGYNFSLLHDIVGVY